MVVRVRRPLGALALAATLLCVASVARAAESDAADAGVPECPPYEAAAPGPAIAIDEPGIEPSPTPPGSGGPLVPLAVRALAPVTAAPGEALLAFPKRADGKAPSDFTLAPGAKIASSYFSTVLCSTVVRVVGPAGADVASLVGRVPPGVAVVRNDVYRTAATELRPVAGAPDPYRDLQWGLDADQIDASRAVTNGSGARVALLDSKPDAAHLDLAGVRIGAGVGASGPPAAHGSLLAGILRAVERNGFGIAGVAPGIDLLSIPVCTPLAGSASDECRLADLLRGVELAWEEKAQILNLSLVGPANPLLERAMDRLDQLGVLLVAAVGNEATDEPRYPAAYPSVIGVGAVDRSGKPYARGNRGASVELLAPGVEIVSTVPGDAFSFGDGTSLAAAHVTATLALATAASGDPLAARTALFQVAREKSGGSDAPAPLPPICEVLAKLGKPCR
jgi:hypothetical protein